MMPIRMTGTETWDKTWDTRTNAQQHNRTKVTSRGGAHLKIRIYVIIYLPKSQKNQELSQTVANKDILVLWDTTFFRNIQKKSTSCLAFRECIMSTCFCLWTPTI